MTKRGPKFKLHFDHEGKKLTMDDIARITGKPRSTIAARLLRDKWTVAETIAGVRATRLHTHAGRSHTIAEWSRLTGIAHQTLDRRLKAGWTLEQALAIPTAAQRRAGVVSVLASLGPDRPAEGQTDRLHPSNDHQTPGVPSDLGPSMGTGAGSTARETPNITFPEKAEA